MKKAEYIGRYGEAAYEKMVQQSCDWYAQHSEEMKARVREWREVNPNKVKASHQEQCRKGGKRYEKMLKHQHTGIQGERNKIRNSHGRKYRPFKQIIAPESQIHHEWMPGTAKYRGVALVETDQHMHGYIDVIKILDGKITLLTEKEIRNQENKI